MRLGPWLRGLGDKYRNELGATTYALVNAATDYASDSNATLMSPGRVDALQVRCGRWTDWTLERYGAALASQLTVEIEVTKEGLNAADRLAAMERAGT